MSQSPYFAAPQKCKKQGTAASWITAVTIGVSAVALAPRNNLLRTVFRTESMRGFSHNGGVTGSSRRLFNSPLGKLFFFGVVRICLTRVIWNPIIKNASHKRNTVFCKSFLDRKQGITCSVASARYEHHTVRQNSDHPCIRN